MSKFSVVEDKYRRLMQAFEDVKTKKKHFFPLDIKLPQRATALSAGYDFFLAEDVTILPNKVTLIYTDIRCKVNDDEFLDLRIRSSLAIKHDLQLANAPGTVDADYYDNPDTGGNIIIAIRNLGGVTYKAKAGEKIAQGIIMKYTTTEDDAPVNQVRTGGVGSTGK